MIFSWKKIKKPILALAPMAGFTDSSFRQIVKSMAKDVVCFSELTSTNALEYGSEKTIEMLAFDKKEQPLILQIFGNKPEFFAESAKKIEQLGIAGIDINMGCPARKVTKALQGSALIKDVKLAAKIVEATKKAVKIPVSVKTRLGYSEYNEEKFIEFCKALEESGADLLTIHGRTVSQGFSGEADWKPIYMIKKHLKIPVIGNGDIKSAETAMRKIGNLDGIMVGRATFGNPWIMKEISGMMESKKVRVPKDIRGKIPTILKHCRLSVKIKGEKYGILEVRKHLAAYIKGFRKASKYRGRLVQVKTFKDVEGIFEEIGTEARA